MVLRKVLKQVIWSVGLMSIVSAMVVYLNTDAVRQHQAHRLVKSRTRRSSNCMGPGCGQSSCNISSGWGILGSDWGCCGNYEGCCTYASVMCYIHDALCRCCDVGGPTFCGPKCQPEPECIAPEPEPELEPETETDSWFDGISWDSLGYGGSDDDSGEILNNTNSNSNNIGKEDDFSDSFETENKTLESNSTYNDFDIEGIFADSVDWSNYSDFDKEYTSTLSRNISDSDYNSTISDYEWELFFKDDEDGSGDTAVTVFG